MRRIVAFILIILMIFSLCSCSETENRIRKFSQTEFVFGTVVTLTVYDEDESSLAGAFELCEKYENMLSSTVEGSDVWKINHAEGESVSVNMETADLIELSISYSDMTDGAFDITVAPISELWGFSDVSPTVPDSTSIEELLPYVDYSVIALDGTSVTVPKNCKIELGAVAKGYISDRLCDYFRDFGVSAALINLGGNVATFGTKPDNSPWVIGIRDPIGDYSDYVGTLSLGETSVVTSGIYERSFESDGVLYHHLLNPDTGYPENNEIASVTIICASGADADALSTSLYLMGAAAGLEFAENADYFEAVFILKDGRILKTSGIELDQQ